MKSEFRTNIIFTSLLLASSMAAADVTVISFGGAGQKGQQKAYYDPFTKATGVKIVMGEYNGEQAKIKAMVEAGNVTWDVVDVEQPELLRGCEEGLYEKLDLSKLRDKKDMIPGTLSDCGVGNMIWTMALTYNKDKLSTPPRNWADFWNVGKYPGKRGLRKGAKFTLEFALLADGVKSQDIYKELRTKAGVDKAFRKLDQIKPNILFWETGAQAPQLLASGDLVMSAAYNGRISAAVKEGKNLEIVWNESIYDLDSWAIVKGSKNVDNSHRFISFASQPENQKIYSNELPYGPTNINAIPLLDAKAARELPTHPSNMKGAMEMSTKFWVEHGEDLEQKFNAWASK
jgi:putative spermidine/putrescine transport system substrate-binding protein